MVTPPEPSGGCIDSPVTRSRQVHSMIMSESVRRTLTFWTLSMHCDNCRLELNCACE
jgi:hypothetical protein